MSNREREREKDKERNGLVADEISNSSGDMMGLSPPPPTKDRHRRSLPRSAIYLVAPEKASTKVQDDNGRCSYIHIFTCVVNRRRGRHRITSKLALCR